MAENSYWSGYWRQFWKSILEWYVAFAIFLVALAGVIGLGYVISGTGVLPVAVIVLSAAVVLSLCGSFWLRPLAYVGAPLAWLSMTVVFVERLVAFGLNGWAAAAWWVVASGAAAVVYLAVEVDIEEGPNATRYRSLLFYGLCIAWPATALPFVERGNAIGLSIWITIGSWLVASCVALVVCLRAFDLPRVDNEPAP